VAVACPAGYVYAVEGLVEERAEVGERGEDEGVRWGEGESEGVDGEGFEAEVECLFQFIYQPHSIQFVEHKKER
jgi:hypothetical protein